MDEQLAEFAIAQMKEAHDKLDRVVERLAALEAGINAKIDNAVKHIDEHEARYSPLAERVSHLEASDRSLRTAFKFLAWGVSVVCLVLPPIAAVLIQKWLG